MRTKMNLKGVAPGYGTLVPLFAWRIKRNEFGHFHYYYYKQQVCSSKAVTILNYSFEKFIPLKKELQIESFLVFFKIHVQLRINLLKLFLTRL